MTPEEEQEVVRLLRAAGDPPLPPEVAARLDAHLDDLVAERVAERTDLTLVRRRRRWGTAVLAAAAVAVGGYSLSTVTLPGTSGGGDESAAGGASSSLDEGATDSALSADGSEESRSDIEDVVPGPTALRRTDPLLVGALLRRDTLAADIRRVVEQAPLATDGGGVPDPDGTPTGTGSAPETGSARVRACLPPAAALGQRWYSVILDGERAILVTSAPKEQDRVLATVYDCEGETLEQLRVALDG